MKKLLIVLLLGLTACVPSINVDVGSVASRAASQAVESAVESAVDAVVRGIVGGILDRVVELIVSAALSGLFPADGELEFGADFALDIYSGSYELMIEGDLAEAGSYRFTGGQPISDQEQFSYAVALRGQNGDGERFSALNLVRVNETDGANFSLVIVEDESMPGLYQAGLQLLDDDEDTIYVGDVEVTLTQSSASRYAGSFQALNLMSEEGGQSITVTGSFDVPINPAGSLIIRASSTN